MNINKLRLKDIVNNYKILEQEFEYAGIRGIAEILGYQILFFRKESDLNKTVVITFDEIDNDELVGLANSILDNIGINVKFGDSYKKIEKIYGVADFKDNIYENVNRLNYILMPRLFMSFGIKDNVLLSLEIVTDEHMIKEIVSVRKN